MLCKARGLLIAGRTTYFPGRTDKAGRCKPSHYTLMQLRNSLSNQITMLPVELKPKQVPMYYDASDLK